MEKKKKYLSDEVALSKMQSYCAYQERCHVEVATKLRDLGVYGDRADVIIAKLIEDNFLNEERFAVSFARGKFRMKKWGKIRIKQELKMRQIPDYSIKKAMQAIDTEGGYLEVLKNMLISKLEEYIGDEQPQQKAANYALRKGFEGDLVWETLKNIKNN
jgi:regulatory protein